MKVGLEVHQQLATGKLFCACPSELTEEVLHRFSRRLRAAQGENRAVDAAAALQASRHLVYQYEATPSDCLVDMDEEPPHPLSGPALDTALTMALLLGARPVDEVEIMRKIVVDGSNTSGFQRTALIATGGSIEAGGRRYGIETICLEEDAARKVGETADGVTYRLDRLGIPLIEIATAPEITNGREAREVAEEIGALLRATGRVRRGIGTIREDLNVSTDGGRRIEIKGVQELRLMHEYADREVHRQQLLLQVRDRLRERSAVVPTPSFRDVTAAVGDLSSGPLAHTADRGHVVLALALPKFAGLLRSFDDSDERLGRELADQARSAGLKGLLHSDELPGHGVPAGSVEAVRAALGLGPEDAFALVVDRSRQRAEAALQRVAARAAAALDGVPGETRDPLPDGRTRFSRPLPGRDRMYPETDVPPVPITSEHLEHLRRHLPERPGTTRARLVREYGLADEVARQLVASGDVDELDQLVRRGRGASLAARLLTQDLPAALGSVGEAPRRPVSLAELDAVLQGSESGRYGKEGIPLVLHHLLTGAPSVEAAVAKAGFTGAALDDLDPLADRVVRGNAAMVRERGEGAFSALMGDLMREVRGRRDGKEVAAALRRAIDRLRAESVP